MKKAITIAMALLVALSTCAFAQDKATPTEVYEQVNKASEMLTQLGEEGLPAFNDDPKGEFVWKDSYVFVPQLQQAYPGRPPGQTLFGRRRHQGRGHEGPRLRSSSRPARRPRPRACGWPTTGLIRAPRKSPARFPSRFRWKSMAPSTLSAPVCGTKKST